MKNRASELQGQNAKLLCNLVYKWSWNHLPVVLSRSANTVRTYRTSLSMFATFLEEKKGITPYNLSIDAFSCSILNEWQNYMREELKESASTCNNRMAAIKSLLQYMGAECPDLASLYVRAKENIKPVKGVKKNVESISKEALKVLFAQADLKSRLGRRNYAFMLFTYGTAGRLDEVLSVQLQDIHFETGKSYVRFLGKGNTMRIVPILDELAEIIKGYISEYHGKSYQGSDLLFYSPTHGIKGKLTQAAMYKVLRKYAMAANEQCPEVPTNMHPHILRHCRATHWREEGVSLVEIMKLLGHSSYQSTLIYQTVTNEQKREAIKKLGSDEINDMPKKWLLPENSHLIDAFGLRRK